MSQSGRKAIAMDIVREVDLSGKTVIVTGATSGIGTETARALAHAGAEVILPSRDIEFGCTVADRLVTDTGNAKVRTYEMDLADLDSVRRFADNFLSEYRKVDILINNAGVMAWPLTRTPQGYELHFAINYLSHFLLTACLGHGLAASESSRVISLSAAAHRLSPVDFEDLHFERRPYDKWLAYGQSKTANALFALALNQHLEEGNGRAFAVNPGPAMTNLQRNLSRSEMQSLGWLNGQGAVRRGFQTAAQAAATTVWAATAPVAALKGGAYFENCRLARASGPNDEDGVQAHARDMQAAARLWDLSERMVDRQFVLPRLGRRQAVG